LRFCATPPFQFVASLTTACAAEPPAMLLVDAVVWPWVRMVDVRFGRYDAAAVATASGWARPPRLDLAASGPRSHLFTEERI